MRSIKRILAEQDLAVGLMIQQVCKPWIAKLYADAGADFIYVENEHMQFNAADLADLVLASRLCGLPVVAKCSYVNRGDVCKLLDGGVTGIQLPMCETAEQIAEIVSYCRFPPVGVRAAAPGTGNTSYEPVEIRSWLRQADEEVAVLAHIETAKGVANADAIMSVPGVDILFIGMFDLSVSLGHPAEYSHPAVETAMQRLLDTGASRGKVVGMWAPNFELAERWLKRGVRFVETTGDVGLIANGSIRLMSKFPGHGPRISAGGGHI